MELPSYFVICLGYRLREGITKDAVGSETTVTFCDYESDPFWRDKLALTIGMTFIRLRHQLWMHHQNMKSSQRSLIRTKKPLSAESTPPNRLIPFQVMSSQPA